MVVWVVGGDNTSTPPDLCCLSFHKLLGPTGRRCPELSRKAKAIARMEGAVSCDTAIRVFFLIKSNKSDIEIHIEITRC